MSVRRVLGAVAVVGIATALVAQALPATPVTRDARAADQPAALSAASGAAPQVVAPAGPSTSTVPALVGRLPAPALRMTAVSRARQRPMTAVSRTRQRPALPGCDGRAPASGHANGQIPVDELCALPFAPTQRLRADAAVALAGLDTAYAEVFGDDLCVSDSYRTIGAQLSLAARKPGLAARPGRSEHGWAIAVDLCGKGYSTGTREHDWLLTNARRFGWDNPGWARADGAKPEPWHWEYVVGQGARSSAVRSG